MKKENSARKSKITRTELKVRCSLAEGEILKERAELAGINSLSRYLLECGLNVRGIQDWQEREMRTELIDSLTVITGLLSAEINDQEMAFENRPQTWEHIKEDVTILEGLLERLIYLHETNLLNKEEADFLKANPIERWNYYEREKAQVQH